MGTNVDDDEHEDKAARKGSAVFSAYMQYKSVLRAVLRRYLRKSSDQEDLLQETFTLAYEAEHKNPINHPKSYLFKVAKSLAIRESTKMSTKLTDHIEDFDTTDLSSNEPSAFDALSGKEEMNALNQAIAALPPQCRKVFVLRKFHGLSHKEIAETMGLSTSTTEKHLAKALEKCSAYMRLSTAQPQDSTKEPTKKGADPKTPAAKKP
ncbi:MAG: sigma-70 family RNA polymerase sigma factor [Pseudomonadota bacterium]